MYSTVRELKPDLKYQMILRQMLLETYDVYVPQEQH